MFTGQSAGVGKDVQVPFPNSVVFTKHLPIESFEQESPESRALPKSSQKGYFTSAEVCLFVCFGVGFLFIYLFITRNRHCCLLWQEFCNAPASETDSLLGDCSDGRAGAIARLARGLPGVLRDECGAVPPPCGLS